MNQSSEEQLELIHIQYLINTILLGALVFSFLFAYNAELKLKGQAPFWDDQTVRNLTIAVRMSLLIGTLISIYVNFTNVDRLIKNGAPKETIESAQVQAVASVLGVVVAVLVLWAILHNPTNDIIIDIENPEL